MKIDTELELRHDYELRVKMYNLCDKIAESPYGHPTTREDEIKGVKSAIRKIEREIEREIVAFHTAHPERIDLPKAKREEVKTPEPAGAAA